jgi:tetratricopeptide (TPR) repeat protein
LLEGGSGWGGASTGLSRKPLIEKLDKKPSPNKDMNGFVRATLADIAEAVNDHPRLATPFAPGALPQVDAAVAALARLPRPPVGDRARAKELSNQANQLMARSGDWSEMANLMAQAHAADPQDAEILNFLAYTQMQSGRHAEALTSILESLRLAPTSANGWNRLAQIRLAGAKGDARQIQEASRYYVATYWFSRDRPRVMRYFNGELTVGPGDSPDNPAAVSIALQRLPK